MRLIIFPLVIVTIFISNGNESLAQERNDKGVTSGIETDVDPKYVYEYDQTKFVPPEGKTLLIMGQTIKSIDEYKLSFPDEVNPAGWSAYWAIPEFKGIRDTFQTGSGDYQNHQMLVDRFPNSVIHSAMWMSGNWEISKKAYLGVYDDVIKEYSKWAKEIDRPIYLRIGYEFDGPHNALEPKEFVRAYRRIVDIMRSEGVDNVAFVWHSYAAPTFKGYPLSDWYPGDDYVDWVGLSVFFQPYYSSELNDEGNAVLDFAISKKKPVMIAESNPVRGVDAKGIELWDSWFSNFFSMTYRKNIKAICFINEDWPRFNNPGLVEWKDARIYNNDELSKAWFEETNKARYLKQSIDLFEKLGYMQK